MINVFVVNLKENVSFEEIDVIVSKLISDMPDIVVFTGYKRRFQERIEHPIQNI